MSGLSEMQAKRLAATLAVQAKDGNTDVPEFQEGLVKYAAYQQQQRAKGIANTRRQALCPARSTHRRLAEEAARSGLTRAGRARGHA